MTKPFFSIVIPTLNEEDYLPLLLKSLVKQTFTDFEVLHIDGYSEDKTLQKATSFSKEIPIKSFTVKKRNVAFQRNFGAQKANGSWILFMDADIQFDSSFLQNITDKIKQNQSTDLFTSWCRNDKKTPVSLFSELILNYFLDIYKAIGKPIAVGAFIGAKQKVAKHIPFDENLTMFEDFKFVRQASEEGFRFTIFRHPKYISSIRRIKQDGFLKIVFQTIVTHSMLFLGADFKEHNFGYKMSGGKYYEKSK